MFRGKLLLKLQHFRKFDNYKMFFTTDLSSHERKSVKKAQKPSLSSQGNNNREGSNSDGFGGAARVGCCSFVIMSALTVAHTNTMIALDIENTMLLSSLGASCFLLCHSPEKSIAQPRNVIGGHFIGATCGVMSNILIATLDILGNSDWSGVMTNVNLLTSSYLSLLCGGPLAVSAACVTMMLTRATHFPAAGTALGISIAPIVRVGPYPTLLDIIWDPQLLTIMANVMLSSSSLVGMAYVLHKGEYPNKPKSL